MTSYNQFFPKGVQVRSGNAQSPSYSFFDSPRTGIFFNDTLGGVFNGRIFVDINANLINFMFPVRCAKLELTSGTANSYLKLNDNLEVVPAQLPSLDVKSINLNEYYSTGGSSIVVATDTYTGPPNVFHQCVTSQNNAALSLVPHINNITNSQFNVDFGSQIYSNISAVNASHLSAVRHYDDTIGLCYYDVDRDRMMYKCSKNTDGTRWFDAIEINQESSLGLNRVVILNNKPAVVYFKDDGEFDELHIVTAKDFCGFEWNAPVVVHQFNADMTMGSLSLGVTIYGDQLVVFFSNDVNTILCIKSTDLTATAWQPEEQVSDFTDHELLDARVVDGKLVLLVKGTAAGLFYAQSVDGDAWDVGEFADDSTPLNVSSVGYIGSIGGALTAIVSNNTHIFLIQIVDDELQSLLLDTVEDPNKTFDVVQGDNVAYITYSCSPSIKKVVVCPGSARQQDIRIHTIVVGPDLGSHACVPAYDAEFQMIYSSGSTLKSFKYYDDVTFDMLVFKK